MADMTKEEFAKLIKDCAKELKTGKHQAAEKILEIWKLDNPTRDENIYKAIQLLCNQELYYSDPWGKVSQASDLALTYAFRSYPDDYRAYMDQWTRENQRGTASVEEIQKLIEKFNSIAPNKMSPIGPGETPKHRLFMYGGTDFPSIYHGASDDPHSIKIEDDSLSAYSKSTEKTFFNIAIACLGDNIPILRIDHSQVPLIASPIEKSETAEKEEKPTPANKPKSKFAELMEKLSLKSTRALESRSDQEDVKVSKKIASLFEAKPKPIDIGQLQRGMTVLIPAGCTDMVTGQKAESIEATIYGIFNRYGQFLISTDKGVITTRDMSMDIAQAMERRIQNVEYQIEHAEEIAAREAAEKAERDYKTKWFDEFQTPLPETPYDDRLDLDDMHYFGYTPETFRESALERSNDYDSKMESFNRGVESLGSEIVARCLDENIRMIYIGKYPSDFTYHGTVSGDFSRAEFEFPNHKVPKPYNQDVHLPDTSVDMVTGEQLGYDDLTIYSIHSVVETEAKDFAMLIEGPDHQLCMVTSYDFGAIARDMIKEIEGQDQEESLDTHKR